MYHEHLAKLTADHLRSHIEAYLDVIQLEDPKLSLIIPKDINPASVVGGTISEFSNILPQYGVDVLSKTFGEDVEGLFTYNYQGQINGVVDATSRDAVDKLCGRHARAVEQFIKKHRLLHQDTDSNSLFTVLGFGFTGLEFSGAENLGEYEDREVWIAGFSINVIWVVSEDSEEDHGSA